MLLSSLFLFALQVSAQTFQTASQQALRQRQLAQTQGAGRGITTEGNEILIMSADIEGLEVQFKVAAPANLYLAAAQQGAVISTSSATQSTEVSASTTNETATTATVATGTDGNFGDFIDLANRRTKRHRKRRLASVLQKRQTNAQGINILLHGDGGQSFFDFPNQLSTSQNGLIGVVALAPNNDIFWGGGAGLQRTDGVLHSQLVNSLITQILPQVLDFDPSQTFFTGVSGGSLLLSGFTLPLFGSQFNTGAILNCGGLTPQVQGSLGNMKIHFQTTVQEQAQLQDSIPPAAQVYASVLGNAVTIDATPNGGHCEFDGQGFVSGIQLMADNFANVIFGTGNIDGIGNVLIPVTTNTQTFGSGVAVALTSRQGQGQRNGRNN